MTPPARARDVVLFGDVEAALVTYLTQELAEHGQRVGVHTRIPAKRPAGFVTVTRVGGTRRGVHLDDATVVCECWAARPSDAHRLAQLVRGLLHALPGRTADGMAFARVGEFAAPANLPDPESRQARYTATYQVSARPIARTVAR